MTPRFVLPRVVALSALLCAVVATPRTSDTAAAQNVQEPVVQVIRHKFHDACFVASVDSATDNNDKIAVRLTIEHKRNSGQCGCRSAALKALIFMTDAPAPKTEAAILQQRQVQTTPAFANSLASYSFDIKKRRLAHGYGVWLTCAS